MDYKIATEKIFKLVRLQCFSLGVKIVKKGETLPEDFIRPSKYDLKISLCQWTTMARRWGRNVGVGMLES